MNRHQAGASVFVMALMPGPALAQSATPGAVVTLAPVVVEAEAPEDVDVAEERLRETPGGAALIRSERFKKRATVTLSDALDATPGVVVQDFFGGFDQPRVQIRGSGLQQSPVERGVLFLQDGLPLNRADGSYIVGLANPRQTDFIEVNRGYTANRLGATVLGGALNFVSPTGSTAEGLGAGLSGGAFGQIHGEVQAGFADDGVDAFVFGDTSRRDGFRDKSTSQRDAVGGNAGVALTEEVSARLFAGYTDLSFDIPGPLTRELLERDPESVFGGPTVIPGAPPTVVGPGPNVVRDDPRREATQARAGVRVTGEFGAHVVDAAVGYAYTDDVFIFPIASGVRETEGGDTTIVGRYAFRPDRGGPLPLVEATASYSFGSADRRYFLNEAGERGAQFGAHDLEASTLALFAGGNVPLGAGFTLSPAIAWARATRDNDDVFGAATRPTIAFNPLNPDVRLPDGAVPTADTSYGRTYAGVSPSLALSWRPLERQRFFVAASRSFEPPTHDDLLATTGGTPNSSAGRPNPAAPGVVASAFATPDLEAQTATTIEGGWRGGFGPVGVDAVVYHSWVEDELLTLRDVSGASLGAVNAGSTRHLGVELGVDAAWAPVSGRLAYTFQDFRFVDDPERGDNKLAGAPPHVINLEADWAVTDALTLGGRLYWRPEETPVDNQNTVFSDPFATLDLRAFYRPLETVDLFAEVRNAFDETFASSTLVVDQARPDQAAFLPGDGRAFYVGLAVRF